MPCSACERMRARMPAPIAKALRGLETRTFVRKKKLIPADKKCAPACAHGVSVCLPCPSCQTRSS